MIRIVIIDDHEMIRDALATLLGSLPEIEVVATASSIRDGLAILERVTPDVLLADLSLGDGNATELIRSVRRSRRKCRVVIMTGFSDNFAAAEALKEGAAGYVLKMQPTSELIEAIKVVAAGGQYVSPALAVPANGAAQNRSGFEKLSRRESEIFRMVVKGAPVKEIAQRLFISVKTVETHRTNINRKLSVRTTADLIRLAAAHGIAIAPQAPSSPPGEPDTNPSDDRG